LDGPWRLERGALQIEVAYDHRRHLQVCLVYPRPAVVRGHLIAFEERRPLVHALPEPPDSCDAGGLPLHTALAAASYAIGPEAARLTEALDALAEVWADTLDKPASADIEVENGNGILRICVLHPHGFDIHRIIPVGDALTRRAALLAVAHDLAEAAPLQAPATSAHQRAERQGRARALLTTLGVDGTDLLPP
jgi:hypothetical protein